jgi:hypothetical protein
VRLLRLATLPFRLLPVTFADGVGVQVGRDVPDRFCVRAPGIEAPACRGQLGVARDAAHTLLKGQHLLDGHHQHQGAAVEPLPRLPVGRVTREAGARLLVARELVRDPARPDGGPRPLVPSEVEQIRRALLGRPLRRPMFIHSATLLRSADQDWRNQRPPRELGVEVQRRPDPVLESSCMRNDLRSAQFGRSLVNAMSRRHDKRRTARRRHNANRAAARGELLAENQVLPLLWRPWYFDRLSRVEGVVWFWPVIQWHCELDDPESFPAILHSWTDHEVATMTRYVEICARLVGSAFLNQDATVKIELLTNKVTGQSRPPDDATAGFIAWLRQVFNHTEEASFDQVHNMLSNGAHVTGAAEATDALKTWKKAHKALLRNDVQGLLHVIAQREGLISGDEPRPNHRMLTNEELTPKALIDVFLNGDVLHWGTGRDDLARWRSDEVHAAMMDSYMRSDAAMLAHFFVGFAGVVRRSLAAQNLAA